MPGAHPEQQLERRPPSTHDHRLHLCVGTPGAAQKSPALSVAIVTDSTSYIPPSLIDRWGIQQVPLYVGWDGDMRREHEYHDLDAFYARLHESPRQPSRCCPGDDGNCLEGQADSDVRHRDRPRRARPHAPARLRADG